MRSVVGAPALALAIVATLSPACVGSEAEMCDFGVICPAGMVCSKAHLRCVYEAQLIACEGLDDLALCSHPSLLPGYCRSGLCIAPTCGNGVREPGEACDDHNTIEGDACNADCSSDYSCGNGVVDPEEECDLGEGNSEQPDAACRTDCELQRCGDDVRDSDEECDDGLQNGDEPGACRLSCLVPRCGDGILDPDEECERDATPMGECNPDCTRVECGNGRVDLGEECDAGSSNADLPNAPCRLRCTWPSCGDEIVDSGSGELCDAGAENSNTAADACREDCQPARCGDGVIDTGEQCDDGNGISFDGCSAACLIEFGWNCDAGQPTGCTHCPDHRYGLGCEGCAVLVDVNTPASPGDGRYWATAFPTVQQGIDRAAAQGGGCEVWVARGTYHVYQADRQDTIQLRSGVTVLGGFAGGETHRDQRDWELHVAVLAGGDRGNHLAAYHVVTAHETSDATLDGLTITGGQALGSGEGDAGGGLHVRDAGRLAVMRCTFVRNVAIRGGAMYVGDATVLVTDSVFFDNSASNEGGAVYAEGAGALTMMETRILGNLASTGGGVYARDGVGLDVRDTEVLSNTAAGGGGGMAMVAVEPVIDRCVFAQNYGIAGGAIYNYLSGATINECTFSGNTAGVSAGAISVSASWVIVTNSVFSGQLAGEAGAGAVNAGGGAIWASGSAHFRNSVFAGNTTAREGGAIYIRQRGNVSLSNTTLAANRSSVSGGAVTAEFQAHLDLQNSISWGNRAPVIPEIDYILSRCHNLVSDAVGGNPPTNNPLFVGALDEPVAAGTWTAIAFDAAAYQTILTDDYVSFVPGALRGSFVQPEVGDLFDGEDDEPRWFVIVDNTEHTIRVWGDFTAYPWSEHNYAVHDLRLRSNSPCIDGGYGCSDPNGCSEGRCRYPHTAAVDIEGNPLFDAGLSGVNGGEGEPPFVDLGAYEWH